MHLRTGGLILTAMNEGFVLPATEERARYFRLARPLISARNSLIGWYEVLSDPGAPETGGRHTPEVSVRYGWELSIVRPEHDDELRTARRHDEPFYVFVNPAVRTDDLNSFVVLFLNDDAGSRIAVSGSGALVSNDNEAALARRLTADELEAILNDLTMAVAPALSDGQAATLKSS